MSTFPLPCPDDITPSMTDVYRGISDNSADISAIERTIVDHVNDVMRDNALDLAACDRCCKREISSVINSSKRELQRLADSLMEVILHGVADIAVTGDSATRHIDDAIATSPDTPAQNENGEGSGTLAPIGGFGVGGHDGGEAGRDRTGARVPVLQLPEQTGAGPIVSAGANVVTVAGLDGRPIAQLVINITVLPAPVQMVDRQILQQMPTQPQIDLLQPVTGHAGQSQEEADFLADPLAGLQHGRGGDEGYSMGMGPKVSTHGISTLEWPDEPEDDDNFNVITSDI